MGFWEVFGIGFGCFFIGGLFGFLIAALCVANSQTDTYTDAELLAQMKEKENGRLNNV